ncbi:MAG TPA: phage tail tube protein [Thermodesulfobacteriota bacterium]
MGRVLGRATIKADGQLLETKPGAKLDLGGVTRSSILSNSSVDFAEQPKQARLECEISLKGGMRLADLQKMRDVTVTFEADTGQSYVVRNAFLVDPPVITDGQGGQIPVVFEGPPAEEVG